MSAFDALEKRLLDLSLTGQPDAAEAVVTVGLFTSQPPEDHSGAYGIAGEPQQGAYVRPRVQFPTAAEARVQGLIGGGSDPGARANRQAVTVTGLPPGTYTHFGIFGSSSGGTQ